MNHDVIWKDVIGYESLYEVSNYGQVRSKAKVTTVNKYGKVINRVWQPRILKNKNPSGRDVRVALWKNKKPKDFLVHRLVAEAFLTKTEEGNCVNHIDGNPKNNHISNLEWCTHEENNNHAFDNQLINTSKQVKLTDLASGVVLEFRSLSAASKHLGKSVGFISYFHNKYESDTFELLNYKVEIFIPENYSGTKSKATG